MNYDELFMNECLRNDKLGSLIKSEILYIDLEHRVINFQTSKKVLEILPFSVDANSDGPLLINLRQYEVLFLLDGIAGFGDFKKIPQTVNIFSVIISALVGKESALIEKFSLWGISRLRIKTSKATFISMPFDDKVSLRELGQLIPIIGLGRKERVSSMKSAEKT